MKRLLIVILLICVLLTSCSSDTINQLNNEISDIKNELTQMKKDIKELKETSKATPMPTPSSESSTDTSKSNSNGVAFTNKFGTSTTKCAHSGCTNYIATSGDTNCCAIHSQKCLDCGVYIDEDATWCMDCIAKALNKK